MLEIFDIPELLHKLRTTEGRREVGGCALICLGFIGIVCALVYFASPRL